MTTANPERIWLRLPFAPESASEARRRLDAWVHDNEGSLSLREDWSDDAKLVISELIGNSLRHATPLADGTLQIGWKHDDGGFDIAVRDGGGPDLPEVRDVSPMASHGRGLAIVEALAKKWWVDHVKGRVTTHALVV